MTPPRMGNEGDYTERVVVTRDVKLFQQNKSRKDVQSPSRGRSLPCGRQALLHPYWVRFIGEKVLVISSVLPQRSQAAADGTPEGFRLGLSLAARGSAPALLHPRQLPLQRRSRRLFRRQRWHR